MSTTTDPERDVADTRPLLARARAAMPGLAAVETALAAVDDRIRQLHEPDPAPVDASSITVLLLAGEPLPADLGAVLSAHTERTAARHREVQLLNTVRDGLERRRDSALRDGNAAAFQWLDQRLQELVKQGRTVLARLGPVRTAEAALDAADPVAVRDDLHELGALAAQHEQLREAQVHLVGVVAAVSPRHLTWREQLALVREHGLTANPAPGTPPDEPLARWVWLLDTPSVAPAVPAYAELMRRAASTKPASPPTTATADQGEPYRSGPGAAAQQQQRIRQRMMGAATT